MVWFGVSSKLRALPFARRHWTAAINWTAIVAVASDVPNSSTVSGIKSAVNRPEPSAVAVPWPVRGADHEDVLPDLKFDYCDFSVLHSAPCSILPCLLLSVGHTFRRTRLQIFITQQKAWNAPNGCARIEMVVEWKVRFYDVRGTSAFIVLLRWTLERWHVGQIETSQLHY